MPFASFMEDIACGSNDLKLKTEKPFYIKGDTNVDVLQNNSKTASYIDLCNSFPCKHLSEEYATGETETTASCSDHLLTNSSNETICIILITSGLTDHHGLLYLASCDSKGCIENNIRF